MVQAFRHRAACAALLIPAAVGIALAQPRFPTPLTRIGYYASALAVGDLDRDGLQDLVVAEGTHIGVMLGHGDGTFQPEVAVESGYSVESIALADLDGDGALDVAALSNNESFNDDILLFWGHGDGTLSAGDELETLSGSNSIVAVDLDGNGTVDLAVTGHPGISVRFGLGTRSFAEPIGLSTYGGFARGVAAADFDRDGHIDLATCYREIPWLTVFPGAAGGGFRAPVRSHASGDLLLAGDFNRDGIPDLILQPSGIYSPRGMAIVIGKGDGGFRAPQFLEPADLPFDVVAGDFNADGKLDLAAVVQRAALPIRVEILTLLGRGDGTFGPPQYTIPLGFQPRLAVGDLDGDGKPDLAIAGAQDAPGEYRNAFVGVLHGLGTGRFGPQLRYSEDRRTSLMTPGDFDGDGALDVASPSWGAISWSRGDGRGAFGPQVRIEGVATEPTVLAHGDFDGDGSTDLWEVDQSGEMWTLLNRRDGSFDAAVQSSLGNPPQSVEVRDDDGDGRDDLLVVQRGERVCDPGCHPAPGRIALLRSMSDGRFDLGPSLTAQVPYHAVWCAYDAGERPGLAWLEYEQAIGGALKTAVRDGAGGFVPVAVKDADGIALGCADVTGDGRADVVDLTHDALEVWPGLGAGLLGPVVRSSIRGSSSLTTETTHRERLQPADFDGDGRLDIAIGGLLMWGRGDGSFERVGHVMTAGARTVPGDFNGDGWVDLASDAGFVLFNLNGTLDGDADGVADEADNCPTVANRTQDPEACRQAVLDAALVPAGSRQSFTATWRTTHEVDVVAFNLYLLNARRGRVRLNDMPIACRECVGGVGASYSVPLRLARKGDGILLEMVTATSREFVSIAVPLKR